MFEKWQRLPKWFRDTMQIIVPMVILLIIYDLLSPQFTHRPYSITTLISFPFQVIVGFALVAIYNYFKIRSQEKAKAQKAEAERIERLRKEQQKRQHEENSQRNRAVQQHRN
ncbi:hypothetical protein [Secundilactobacillus folii]|uniref:Integral membrane protein n=1 Tax=Secundilactobacillus folii TaxID=2678357 RepID=A0A7X3C2P9_9LACO|nr:hypothetical protein [Secundilactobacillus folii]MTV82062.1 hypothetical protein [Secundilactobacillus folii]